MCFFFSSRRRHTRYIGDWSSDVCSSDLADQIGLLDERYFMYCEDMDWCYRAHEAGWSSMYFPGAQIIHEVGRSSDLLPRRMIEIGRASCRERVWIGVVAGSVKRKRVSEY